MAGETIATAADPALPTGDATGTATGPQNGGDEKRFSQADFDRLLSERLEREKKKGETAAQKAKEEAEAAALAEQQKWQQLAEKHGLKAKTLEEQAEAEAKAKAELEAKAGRYESALTTLLKTQKEGLPAHILGLLEKLDPVEQLSWIASNREALGAKPASGGIPPTPAPSGSTPAVSVEEANKRKQELGQQVRSWM